MQYSVVIAKSKPTTININNKMAKRNSILDDYVVSIGNPFLTLSQSPFRDNITPECAAFDILHDGTPPLPPCDIYTGWAYSIPYTLTEQSGSTLTDYQILLDIDTLSLITAGKMDAGGDDIQFGYNSGSTLLAYWIENGINTANTKIWVKVDSISASSQKIINMYFGNPNGVPSLSSIDDTFIDPFSAGDQNTILTSPSSGTFQLGFTFSPNEDLLVTQLGKKLPDSGSRYVTLFDSDTQAIQDQLQVSGVSGQFSYAPLSSPRWLAKGQSIRLSCLRFFVRGLFGKQ